MLGKKVMLKSRRFLEIFKDNKRYYHWEKKKTVHIFNHNTNIAGVFNRTILK